MMLPLSKNPNFSSSSPPPPPKPSRPSPASHLLLESRSPTRISTLNRRNFNLKEASQLANENNAIILNRSELQSCHNNSSFSPGTTETAISPTSARPDLRILNVNKPNLNDKQTF